MNQAKALGEQGMLARGAVTIADGGADSAPAGAAGGHGVPTPVATVSDTECRLRVARADRTNSSVAPPEYHGPNAQHAADKRQSSRNARREAPASPASTPGFSTAPSISIVGSTVGRPRLISGQTRPCAFLAPCRPSRTSTGHARARFPERPFMLGLPLRASWARSPWRRRLSEGLRALGRRY